MKDLPDEQWCVLDLLMRARQRGIHRVAKKELLFNDSVPVGLRVKLTWAAMTMPLFVKFHDNHELEITEAGVQCYNLRFGKGREAPQPSKMADTIICLPDLSGQKFKQ